MYRVGTEGGGDDNVLLKIESVSADYNGTEFMCGRTRSRTVLVSGLFD